MDDLIERYAALMGMKPHREVLEVVPVDDGHAARTHDGRWTLVRDDGTMRPVEAPAALVDADESEAAMLRGFHGEPEDEAPAGKPAPKRRGRA